MNKSNCIRECVVIGSTVGHSKGCPNYVASPTSPTPTSSAPRTYHYEDPEFGGKIEINYMEVGPVKCYTCGKEIPHNEFAAHTEAHRITPEIAKPLEAPESTPEHGSIMDVVKGRSKALWPSPEVEVQQSMKDSGQFSEVEEPPCPDCQSEKPIPHGHSTSVVEVVEVWVVAAEGERAQAVRAGKNYRLVARIANGRPLFLEEDTLLERSQMSKQQAEQQSAATPVHTTWEPPKPE